MTVKQAANLRLTPLHPRRALAGLADPLRRQGGRDAEAGKGAAGAMPAILREASVLRALLLAGSLALAPQVGDACSCAWQGGFLQVATQAPLIIIGDVVRHEPGPPPALVVWVREVLKGALLDSGMLIQMGDGLHCRPGVEGFPPGSRWVLALNAPGAKPGQGWALSHCGEFWLRVDGDLVWGRFAGDKDEIQAMPLAAFRNRLLHGAGESGCPVIEWLTFSLQIEGGYGD